MHRRARGTVGTRNARPGLWLRWIGSDGVRRLKKADSDVPKEAEAQLAQELENEDAAQCEGPPTFARFLADTYLPTWETEVEPSSFLRAVPQFKRLGSQFGASLLDAITPGQIRDYVAHLRRLGLSPGTIRRDIAVLRPVFESAIEHGHLLLNPVRVRVEATPPRRPEFRSPAELDEVLRLADDGHRGFLALVIDTGLRRTTAVELRWDDVAQDLSALVPSRGRNCKRRIPAVPLTARVRTILRRIRREQPRSEPRVFPHLTWNSVKLWWRRFRERPDAPDWMRKWRLHDFRHQFGSELAQRGVPLPTVADLLGHATARLAAEVYATSSPSDAARSAIRRLERSRGPRPRPRAKQGTRRAGSKRRGRRGAPASRRSR